MLNIVDNAVEICFFPYEYDWACISCRYNLIKQKNELSKMQRKKSDFITRINYAEQKTFCICIDVYIYSEGNDFDKISEVLSTLKNKKLKINKILIEKYKDMLENLDFEQYYWSGTAVAIYKNGHDSIRSMKWLACYDRFYYVKKHYYDLMGSTLKYLNEIS